MARNKGMLYFFNCLRCEGEDESLQIAAQKLHEFVQVESSVNQVYVSQTQISNPELVPPNTPVDVEMFYFLRKRDQDLLDTVTSIHDDQPIVHEELMRTDEYAVTYNYALRWMEKTGLLPKKVSITKFSGKYKFSKRSNIEKHIKLSIMQGTIIEAENENEEEEYGKDSSTNSQLSSPLMNRKSRELGGGFAATASSESSDETFITAVSEFSESQIKSSNSKSFQ